MRVQPQEEEEEEGAEGPKTGRSAVGKALRTRAARKGAAR